jgi:drug/metabolite transporter (DMT)-like permease
MPEEKHQRFRVALAFGLVYVLWGGTYLAMRVVVENIPVYVMGAVRFGISGPLMLAYCALSGRKVRITGKDAFRLLVIGVLLLSISNMGVALAEKYVTSGLAALIVACVPIWVAIIESQILRTRRLSAMGLAGLALGIVGLVVLLWPTITGAHPHRLELLGIAILLGSSASWALGSVLAGRWNLSVDVLTASAWQMTFASIVNVLIAVATSRHQHAVWTGQSVIATVYLVTCGSWIGFTAYIWLLDNVPTPKVATYAYVNPVVALYLGWLFLRERVDGFMLVGTAVVISAVALVNLSKLRSMGTPSIPAPEPTLSVAEAAGD